MFQAVRGTSDLLPAQLTAFRQIEQKAIQLAEKYGFQEIRTPLFEKADLFVRGLGVMASLVEKDLWTFQDKHGQKLALRADMTPCVVRAYQQHRMGKEGPTKLSYVGPVFLLGKEGNEPSRQAYQFGVEVLGNGSPALDAELMVMALEYCEAVGLTGVKLEINSLGCDKCRPAYYDALREFFASRQNELCAASCRRKYRNHPTWVLSCPESSCQTLANLAPTILGYLCQDCKVHFNTLKHLIQELDLEVTFNPRVVRDLEYYNRTVFRLSLQDRTLATGGRYDGLVQQMGGSETPAAGFACYLDEIVAQLTPPEVVSEELDFVFLPDGPESTKALLPVALKLRKAGARVEIMANAQGEAPDARWHIRLVEVNALRGQVDIIDQDSRQQEKCGADRLLARLQHLLGQGQREEGEGRGPRRRLNRLRKEREVREPREHREREPRRHEEAAPAASTVEPREDRDGAEEDENSRRRKRRRRRRGEGEDGFEQEAVAAAPEERSEVAPRQESRSEGRREPRRDPRRRDEGHDEPRPESRHEARPERSAPPPRQEQPAKAFIPSLMLGGVNLAPKPAPLKPAPKVEEPKAAAVTPTSPALGNLNWSIKRSNGVAVDEEVDNTPQGSDRPLRGRRPSRRR
jgi:histidyl-tRNA synthetase